MVKLGIHNKKSFKNYSTLFEAIKDQVEEFKLTSIQIFTHGPRNRKKNKINYKNIIKIGRAHV